MARRPRIDWREQTRQAFESLGDHPRRVVASSMGVFWGAAAIVFLLSFGAGFREYMFAEFARFGEGLVFVFPASTSSGFPGYRKGVPVKFARDDAAAVERENAARVEVALPEHLSDERVLVEGGGRIRRLDLHGVDERYARYRNFDIAWGRFFDRRDVARRQAVAILGHDSATALFGGPAAAVGQRIRVDGRSFEVVGVPRYKGRQYMNTNRPDDKLVIVPITTAEARLGYDSEQISRILLVPRRGVAVEEAMDAAVATLGARAGFHPDDSDAIKWFDTMIGVNLSHLFYAGFMIFIGLAGTVTLMIGGVGIANYHLATLSERTAEIAICKAMGAREAWLVTQTALESLVVSASASLGGVSLGVGSCALLAILIPDGQFPEPLLSPAVVFVTLVALLGVSGIAAAIPAARVRGMEISAALRAAA